MVRMGRIIYSRVVTIVVFSVNLLVTPAIPHDATGTFALVT